MAWGYRLELLGSRDAAHLHTAGRWCSVRGCGEGPRFMSAYRFARATGRAVTTTRPLCVKHARRFSMKYSLAWPQTVRRPRRAPTATWDLAA